MLENYFSINDLMFDEENEYWKCFVLNKKCFILDKTFFDDTEYLHINVNPKYDISEHIQIINEYLKWLNSNDCKNILENYFCAEFNSACDDSEKITVEAIINNKWYELLEIYNASINVNKNGKIESSISFGDNYYEKEPIMTIEIV